jgi:hypothetical protein
VKDDRQKCRKQSSEEKIKIEKRVAKKEKQTLRKKEIDFPQIFCLQWQYRAKVKVYLGLINT